MNIYFGNNTAGSTLLKAALSIAIGMNLVLGYLLYRKQSGPPIQITSNPISAAKGAKPQKTSSKSGAQAKSTSGEIGATAQGEPTFNGRPITQYMVELTSTNKKVNEDAHNAVIEVGGKALPLYMRIFEDDKVDAFVRARAMHAIGIIGIAGRSAAALVCKAVDDKDPVIRLQAVYALGKIGSDPEEAIPILIRKLEDPYEKVRERSIGSLGRIPSGAKRAIPQLVKASKDSNALVCEEAIKTLRRIGIDPTKTVSVESAK